MIDKRKERQREKERGEKRREIHGFYARYIPEHIQQLRTTESLLDEKQHERFAKITHTFSVYKGGSRRGDWQAGPARARSRWPRDRVGASKLRC